jgi:hypothetical protein
MRVFDKPNLHFGWKCPICGTSEVKPVVLVGIDGTEEDGNVQAEQYHVDCIELTQTVLISGRLCYLGQVFPYKGRTEREKESYEPHG